MAEVQILEARRNVPNSRSRNRVESISKNVKMGLKMKMKSISDGINVSVVRDIVCGNTSK